MKKVLVLLILVNILILFGCNQSVSTKEKYSFYSTVVNDLYLNNVTKSKIISLFKKGKISPGDIPKECINDREFVLKLLDAVPAWSANLKELLNKDWLGGDIEYVIAQRFSNFIHGTLFRKYYDDFDLLQKANDILIYYDIYGIKAFGDRNELIEYASQLKNNNEEVKKSEVSREIYLDDKVFREGNKLCLKMQDGTYKYFYDSRGDGFQSYHFRNYLEDLDWYLVEEQSSSLGGVIVIDARTGKILLEDVSIPWLPLNLSPDKKYLIVTGGRAGGAFGSWMRIVKIDSRSIQSILYKASDQVKVNFDKWLDDNSFIVKWIPIEQTDYEIKYSTITINSDGTLTSEFEWHDYK